MLITKTTATNGETTQEKCDAVKLDFVVSFSSTLEKV